MNLVTQRLGLGMAPTPRAQISYASGYCYQVPLAQ